MGIPNPGKLEIDHCNLLKRLAGDIKQEAIFSEVYYLKNENGELKQLGINRSTFYNWNKSYLDHFVFIILADYRIKE